MTITFFNNWKRINREFILIEASYRTAGCNEQVIINIVFIGFGILIVFNK